MGSSFKDKIKERKEASPPRFAVPPVDPETPKSTAATVEPAVQPDQSVDVAPAKPTPLAVVPEESEQQAPSEQSPRLTLVDTSEKTRSLSSSAYPSRHEQLRDLSYHEKRDGWKIIEDALEEYVVKHYGKQFKRRAMDK
ncbi:hypothetical protein [Streptomyces sp. NPDC048341]|uniref:hypothetical protein n=1 Tax=Streptomyces sp. NPDC048341 TaxID=3154620 RepID=UPI0034424BC4